MVKNQKSLTDMPHLGCVGQLVTCLTADMSLIADPGVTGSIPARSHTFVEIGR